MDEPTTIDIRLDSERLTVGAATVDRERIEIAGAAAAEIARVKNADPLVADYALVVRPAQGFASGTPVFTDPTDRALRDMGKIDIAGIDVSLPAGANEIGGVRGRAQLDDTAPTLPAEDAYADLRITGQRGLHVNLRNNAGAEIGVAAAPARVDPTGTTAQPVTDNAGSLTVDAPVGTPVFVKLSDGAAAIEAANLDLDTGAGTVSRLSVGLAAAASGGPVAVPGDAANGLDVDVTRVQGNVTVVQATPASLQATVTPAAGQVFPASDNGGSLTVDAPVATPVAVRISDGAAFISPALDRTTAGGPVAARLSDGAAFYDGAKTGQLPAALVGGRVDANVGAWLGATTPTVGQKAMAASIPVVVASDQSVLTVQGNQPARTTGTITSATSVITVTAASNLNVATVTVAGTYAGVSFVIEGSDDSGTTWYGLQAIDNATGLILQTITPGTNATKSYDATVGGFNQFRVRATAWTSGTANVGITLQSMPYEVSPGVLIGDGTNGPATVKPASTAVAATDKPLAVGLHPSSPLPAGSNVIGALTANQSVNVAQIAGVAPIVDNATFTDGTSTLVTGGFIFDETAGTALTENDAAAARIDSKRAQVTVLEDATTRGTRQAVKAASTAPVAADPAAVVAISPNVSVLAGALAKAEDAVAASGDVGVLALAVRQDAPGAATTSATGDYSQVSTDSSGVLWVRPVERVSYQAGYRLAAATAGDVSLSFTFTANTVKQLATIYHASSATKRVDITKISIIPTVGAAGIFSFEVQPLSATTAPATGNPAVTPTKFNQGDAAAEATCLSLPTTAGSLVAADQPASKVFGWNAAAAAATANPLGLLGAEIVLFESRPGSGLKPLQMRNGVAEGYAVTGRCSAAVALTFTVHIEFSEVVP